MYQDSSCCGRIIMKECAGVWVFVFITCINNLFYYLRNHNNNMKIT